MTEIQFGEEQEFSRPTMASSQQQSWIMRLVMGSGLVRTEKEAEYLMIGVIGICLVVMFFLLTSSGGSKSANLPFQEGQNILLPAEGTTP